MKSINFCNNRKVFYAALLALMMMLGITACKRGERNGPNVGRNEPGATSPNTGAPANKQEAFVRVVNAVPGVNADVYADNNKEFPGLNYKTATPYKPMSDDRHTFSVKEANMDNKEPFTKNSESLDGGEHYTLVVFPDKKDSGGTLKVVEDETKAPSAGKAKVRIINATYPADELDIYLTGQKDALFSGLNPAKESSYKEVDPVQGAIEVRMKANQNPVQTLDVNLEAGKVYTIVLVGNHTVGPKMEAIVLEDGIKNQAGNSSTVSQK